jgi:hypothetical protein
LRFATTTSLGAAGSPTGSISGPAPPAGTITPPANNAYVPWGRPLQRSRHVGQTAYLRRQSSIGRFRRAAGRLVSALWVDKHANTSTGRCAQCTSCRQSKRGEFANSADSESGHAQGRRVVRAGDWRNAAAHSAADDGADQQRAAGACNRKSRLIWQSPAIADGASYGPGRLAFAGRQNRPPKGSHKPGAARGPWSGNAPYIAFPGRLFKLHSVNEQELNKLKRLATIKEGQELLSLPHGLPPCTLRRPGTPDRSECLPDS